MAFAAIGGVLASTAVGGGLTGALVGAGTSALIGGIAGSKGGSSSGSSSGSASRTYDPFETLQNEQAATITRGAWDYAKSFYHPIEEELIDKASRIDENQVLNRGMLAERGVNSGFHDMQRDMRRQGVRATPEQLQAMERNRQLTLATSRAAAQNNDRYAQYDRNLNTLAALTGFGRTSLNSALEASNAAAGLETARNTSGGYTDTSTQTQTSSSNSKSGSI
jgi:hypothetical protein